MIRKAIFLLLVVTSSSLFGADGSRCRKQETREECIGTPGCWFIPSYSLGEQNECILLPPCGVGQYWEELFARCMNRKGHCGEFDGTDYQTCYSHEGSVGSNYCYWESANNACRYRPPSPG